MSSGLIPTASIRCIMCGRVAGHVLRGTFVRDQRAPLPVATAHGSRCGECGGNLLAEPDEPLTVAMAAQLIGVRPIDGANAGAQSQDALEDSPPQFAARHPPARVGRRSQKREQ